MIKFSLLNYFIFTPILLLSSFLILSVNNFMSSWMLMEVNLLCLMLVLLFDFNLSKNNLLIYYIFQAINSYLFMFCFIMLIMFNGYKDIFYCLMIFSLLMKMGYPPFFFWYLKFNKNLLWYNLFIVSTFQKIIPLYILMMILSNFLIFNMFSMIMLFNFVIFCILYIPLIALNYVDLKLVMSCSSMIHLSWMVLLLLLDEKMSFIYLMIYLFLMYLICFIFSKFNINFLYDMKNFKFLNKKVYFLKIMLIFSLCGIPPMVGFLLKWFSVNLYFGVFSYMMILFLFFGSVMSTYFYIRLVFFNLMKYTISMKFNLKMLNISKLNSFFYLFLFLFLLMLLMFEIF